MGKRWWTAWVAALAMAVAGPAVAQGPRGAATAASRGEGARRLQADMDRLAEQAQAMMDRKDYRRAASLYERLRSISEKALGPDHPDVAQALVGLAHAYLLQGDMGRAEPLYLRALAIRENALGPSHPDVADSLDNLAVLYRLRGDYANAEPLHRRALAIREKALGPDHPDLAQSLLDLASLLGPSPQAETLLRRALAIREKAFGPDHPDVATSLSALAALCYAMGDYGRAESLFRRAAAIRADAFGLDHLEVADVLSDLARVYEAMGDHDRAKPLIEHALAVREKALGPDDPSVAASLNDLAGVWGGRYWQAEPLYRRALSILEKAYGPDDPRITLSLDGLGDFYADKGDLALASAQWERSLTLREKAYGPDHPAVADTLSRIAGLYELREDHEGAAALRERVLAIYQAAYGPDHPVVGRVLGDLTELYLAQGHTDRAVGAARRATDIEDRHAAALLVTGSEEQKRRHSDRLSQQMNFDLWLHVRRAPANVGAARLAVTALLRRKGRVLDVMAGSIASLRGSLDPGDRRLVDQLSSVYSRLATQATRGPGGSSPEQYRKDLAALNEERQALEAALGQRSAAFRDSRQLVMLPEVQAKIPEGAALVEIARFRYGLVPRYAAYVLRRSGDPTFADLGEAAPIEAATDALRRALADHDLTRDPKPAARELDRLLMQPVRKLLGDTRWVFVSPDGPLHLVPFGALVDEQGRYLVERYLFSYLTTGRDLLRFGGERGAPREAPLVLANPAFDDSKAPPGPEAAHRGVRSIDMLTQPLLGLGGTEEEASTIARLFPGSRVLLGAEATEEAVKAARAPRLLHLATHGFFLPDQPVPEALLRDLRATPTRAERAALELRENPLLRSGIALAGFNRRRSGSEDGVLTALEVAGLDLHGTRLVVLSTCDSGVGRARAGEGVYGLRRALEIAGSETQVMSLWQVDSGRTRELMQAYYERLQQGAGRSEGMRQVQLAMLAEEETSHPNLWASFIVSGDWRSLEGAPGLPDLRARPGPRGCACTQAGVAPRAPAAWAPLALGLAAAARRRASRARGRPPRPRPIGRRRVMAPTP
ncbi:tetratricopeptide repeat protein [Sorangium sp. So ce385]|uniref:CHAT domain-containing tetratricopeptide repeat protein n=1 Tax=Sorangium sp. So ce385 TaxID=3133308 RepID=UPI003F5CAB91